MPKRRKSAPRASAAATPSVATRARHDGWTPQRQTGFLYALAASGCVAEACASVGLSTQSAYRLRMRPDAQGFRLAWEAALELGIRRLTDACLSRALHGEAVPHYYQGELVGEHRRYDNRLAMFLLRYRDPLRYAASLDQMVYDGHPEAAAAAYAKAHARAADEARDVAAGEAPFIPIPAHGRRPLAEARAAASEAAAAAGTGAVGGDADRRARVAALRRERWEAGRAGREAAETALAATLARLCPPPFVAPAPPPAVASAGRGRAGGDVASPSPPSAAGPPARSPGPTLSRPCP